MSSDALKHNPEEAIKRLERENCGKVLRKMFWLFTGGDTGRWFEGKPQNFPASTPQGNEQELLSRHYSTEFVAGRVYRRCTVNYEISADKRGKIGQIMGKLKECGLVECVNDEKSEGQRCWKLTKFGLACALSVKEEIKEGENITWNVERVKKKMNGLQKIGTPKF